MTSHRSPQQQPIAVVGVSALFPGSQDATGFWNDILKGRDLLTDTLLRSSLSQPLVVVFGIHLRHGNGMRPPSRHRFAARALLVNVSRPTGHFRFAAVESRFNRPSHLACDQWAMLKLARSFESA